MVRVSYLSWEKRISRAGGRNTVERKTCTFLPRIEVEATADRVSTLAWYAMAGGEKEGDLAGVAESGTGRGSPDPFEEGVDRQFSPSLKQFINQSIKYISNIA